jgi:hypothetical protein
VVQGERRDLLAHIMKNALAGRFDLPVPAFVVFDLALVIGLARSTRP